MSNQPKAIVLKFGSSVLQSEMDLPRAVYEVYRWWCTGTKVFAVVSAFGDTTDNVKNQAERVGGPSDSSILAKLLATGEAASSALLGLSLKSFGIPACVFDVNQAGLRTANGPLDGQLVSVNSARLRAAAETSVVVLPGFVGQDEAGETTLLGRGGSDYSALFLAQQLSAECVLLKDVDGLYTSDPSRTSQRASRFARVSYETADKLGGVLIQQKAIRFAAEHRLKFTITSVGAKATTEVGPFTDQLDAPAIDCEPVECVA
jgi:homoserine dehydrogenase